MKQKLIRISLAFFTLLWLSSCSHRMVGNWTIQRYETTTPGKEGITLTNIGTMKYNKNGTGEHNISYSVLGAHYEDNSSFGWKWDDGKYISIEGESAEFSKTWIIIENKKKFQKWKSTDGENNVQIIELKK